MFPLFMVTAYPLVPWLMSLLLEGLLFIFMYLGT